MSPAQPLQHVRVLVAHRDASARASVRALLEDVGAEVLESDERHDAAERVRAERPQVVLLDRELDGGSARGGGLVRDVAGDPELLGVAVILLHPGADVAAVCAALADGAVDVWTTDGAAPELIARVRLAYRSRQLLDLALRRFSDLEDLAYGDELTELPNRRGASRQIDVLISRARRHGHQLALLLVDADRFKAINDEHGHAVGDVVLRELAARLRERVRREDVVGRWGGEEFVVALPETTPDGAVAVAEALRLGVSGTPIEAGGAQLRVTISIGVTAWTGEELDDLVARADHALYAAKAAGRDRVVLKRAVKAA
ncbi:MAG TPA: diguanylate cyclase [Baekduia sp.]|uniref:GGDEF domain-containing response regulator n=1 Tax=Baekduia sp. TaxID=2600305 RepID=UPI002D77D42D|nr:diguanylate cyclase [Baekduia sp.]HET6509788.1 diguanylate cyclase [Baekduia sp.]